MSDAEDKTKTGDRETKDSKDKSKEDGHLDNEAPIKTEDGKDESGKKDKVTPSKKNAKTKNQKKEEKNEVKEEVEDEDDDDDEDEDDNDENETNGKVPLLDQPLQISGTRDRKKVQRFSEEFKPVIKESPKNEIPEGRGLQLGEIARIDSLIQKHTAEKLKPLYKVLFNRPGKLAMVKRNIRKFNGFDFKESSDEYSKKRASLTKLDMKSLKSISSALDLGLSGNRDDHVNNILNFLMEPKDSKKPPLKDSKKREKVSRSSSSSSKKTKRKSNSTGKSKKKVDSEDEDESSEDEMEVDDKESSEDEKKQSSDEKNKSSDEKKESSDEKKDSSEEEDVEEEEDAEEEDSEEEKKKKKAPKKKPAANAKKPAPKKVEQKKVEATKKADTKTVDKKKRKEKESEAKSDEESSEDEPLVKKTKMPPTDEEIKCFVKQILEGANLEEITMKTVCKQVYAAYPEFDLAHKKDFIKTTVKSLIST